MPQETRPKRPMSDHAWRRTDEHLDQDVEDVLAGPSGQEEGNQEQGRENAADRPVHSRLARMPPGRRNIMTMKTTKAMT